MQKIQSYTKYLKYHFQTHVAIDTLGIALRIEKLT
jgi:hypothetical protein